MVENNDHTEVKFRLSKIQERNMMLLIIAVIIKKNGRYVVEFAH